MNEWMNEWNDTLKKNKHYPGEVVHVYNSSIQEAEAGGLWFLGQPGLTLQGPVFKKVCVCNTYMYVCVCVYICQIQRFHGFFDTQKLFGVLWHRGLYLGPHMC
jgi:hypothetical protein